MDVLQRLRAAVGCIAAALQGNAAAHNTPSAREIPTAQFALALLTPVHSHENVSGSEEFWVT
jgi:hypothetical protein